MPTAAAHQLSATGARGGRRRGRRSGHPWQPPTALPPAPARATSWAVAASAARAACLRQRRCPPFTSQAAARELPQTERRPWGPCAPPTQRPLTGEGTGAAEPATGAVRADTPHRWV